MTDTDSTLDLQTDRQADKDTDRQTSRQTDRQTLDRSIVRLTSITITVTVTVTVTIYDNPNPNPVDHFCDRCSLTLRWSPLLTASYLRPLPSLLAINGSIRAVSLGPEKNK